MNEWLSPLRKPHFYENLQPGQRCPSYKCHLTYRVVFGHFNWNSLMIWVKWSKSHKLNYAFWWSEYFGGVRHIIETFFNCQETHENVFFLWFFNRNLLGNQGHHLRPLGAPELVKRGPFLPPENFEFWFCILTEKNCVLSLALSWPFFIGFWLRIPQNDQTVSLISWWLPIRLDMFHWIIWKILIVKAIVTEC